MNKKLKNAISYILFLGIGVLLFYLAMNSVEDKDQLIIDMKSAAWPGIVASFIMGYLAIVSRGLRWLILLEPLGYKPKRWHSIHAVAFAYFANTFVPRSGELARCAVLNQTDNIPIDKLFGTVISERVVDFVMLFSFMAIAILSNLDAFITLMGQASFSGGAGGSGGWSMTSIILIGLVVGAILLFLLRKIIGRTAIAKKAKGFLVGVLDGLKSVRKMRRKGMFIAHTFFIWTMYFCMTYVVFLSIKALGGIGVFKSLFIMVAGGFGMVLPAPGGIGSYQWAVHLGFKALGLDGDLGFAAANVVWLTQTGMMILGGTAAYIALLYFKFKRDKKLQTS